VNLRAERDPERSLGHARIVIEGLPPLPAAIEFVVRREGYTEANLGRAGWQVREERLKPVVVLAEGAATVLIVPPSLTRHLEAMPYLFQIPALTLEDYLHWPDDIDVFDGELQTRETWSDADTADTVVLRKPQVTARDTDDLFKSEPISPPVEEAGTEVKEPRKQWHLFALGGALVAVLVIAGALWFWRGPLFGLDVPKPDIAGPTGPVPGTSTGTGTGTGPAPTQPVVTPQGPTTTPAPPWPEGTDGLSLAEVATRAPTAAALYAVAVRRAAAGRHDDALILYEEAADKGYAPAFTALAKLYDPIGFVPGKPFRSPDPRNAACHYRDAVARGDPAATEPRQALRTHLERERQAGNSSAATALKDCWP
jgi:hypothetical protein